MDGANGGVWKWIAAILVTVLIAGAPAIVQAVRSPTRDDVDVIRDRQVQVLIHLGELDQQVLALQNLVSDLKDDLERLAAGRR